MSPTTADLTRTFVAENAETPPDQRAASLLYRRVWRWHFYAGLVCLPFLSLMAVTGGLYLFRNEIEDVVYRDLQKVEVREGAQLAPSALVERAEAALVGKAVRYVAAAEAGRSAAVGVRTTDGVVSVYLDPGDGRVLGTLPDRSRLMEIVKSLHSLTIAGPVANYWVEIVAGWGIVLVVSGTFLWWPRGRRGGVYSVRASPKRRLWWRDLHAVTGATAAVAILFLAVTGMPWSAFWGKEFARITDGTGIGMPKFRWGPAPPSTEPPGSATLKELGPLPWPVSHAAVPASDPHAGHGDMGAMADMAPASMSSQDIGIDEAVRRFSSLGLPVGTPVKLPDGPRGAYSAMLFPDDIRAERVVHLDRYSGRVLADVAYADYGIAGKATEWGVVLHTGRQFGRINQLVMLAACLSIIVLSVTSVVMWWKRRPVGRLAAPPRAGSDRTARAALVVAVLLGLIYPLLGASMLVALLIDRLMPRSWQTRFGL